MRSTPYVEILPPELTGPAHPQWHEARKQGVTASEIAAVLGIAPRQYSSAFKLYWQKQGALGEDPDERRTRWGRRLERHIAEEFAEAHPEFVVQPAGLYAHAERPWQMASPDRLIVDSVCLGVVERDGVFYSEPDAALEAKAWHSWDGWGEQGTDQIPVHIRAQALWQADVLGVPVVYVPVANGSDYREYVVTVDDDAETDLKLMREHALAFMARLARGEPPDVDGTPATIDALKRLHPDLDDEEARVPAGLAQDYRRACRGLRRAEDRKRLCEARLRDRMKRSKYAVDPAGDRVASRSVYEVKEHVRRASTVDKLVPAKEKT